MEDDYSHDHDTAVTYITSNIPGKGCDVELFQAIAIECQCRVHCEIGSCPCLAPSGGASNYDKEGLLINHSNPIYECWEGCSCDINKCNNRVVQRGPTPGLVVKQTGTLKGLGLFTSRALPKGLFVCEYAGEVIGPAEAESRNTRDKSTQKHNYIYWINESYGNKGSTVTTIIDPTALGNIGRYANHSCDPNLTVCPVRVESAVPKICLFSNRDIHSGEELTFDYGVRAESSTADGQELKECHCGEGTCAGRLPFHNLLLDLKKDF